MQLNSQNNEQSRSVYFLFFPCVLAGLFLCIVHLPDRADAFRPDLLSLFLIFFSVFDPRRINMGWAWIAGLLLDFLTGAPLSQNALCLALQVYIIAAQFRRFAQFVLWQQMIIVFTVNLLSHVLGYWISHIAGNVSYEGNLLYPAVLTALLWPVVFYLCRLLCSGLNIKPDTPKED